MRGTLDIFEHTRRRNSSVSPDIKLLCFWKEAVSSIKTKNGFWLGAGVGFLGYLIQKTSEGELSSIYNLLLESLAFGLFAGVLFWLGTSALSGRGHADIANSEKEKIRPEPNKEKVMGNDKNET